MRKSRFFDILSSMFLLVSAVLLVVALSTNRSALDTADAAQKLQRRLDRRIELLDRFLENETVKLPSDMVVYHYEGDSLKNWRGQFTVSNDDIEDKVLFERLTNPRLSFKSPLTDVNDSLGFYSFGPKWYLAKTVHHEDGLVIAGVEIMDTVDNVNVNGVNPRLHLSNRFSISTLDHSGGTAVIAGGRPQFKVTYDSLTSQPVADAGLVWLAFSLLLVGLGIFMWNKRTYRRFIVVTLVSILAMLAMFLWGHTVQDDVAVFSPVLYAGGPFFNSLGIIVLANFEILILVGALFLVRGDLYRRVTTVRGAVVGVAACFMAMALVLVYSHMALRSVIFNSNINLELYKLQDLNVWSAVVYSSFMVMLLSVPMLLQMLQPALCRLTGRHFDVFSTGGKVVMASLFALYFVLFPAVLGFHKEHDRAEVWSNRLAIDRDITLELQLRRAEAQIAEDSFIAPLSMLEAAETTIRNRIAENYLSRISQNYDINVYLLNSQTDAAKAAMVNEKLQGGEPIFEDSSFMFIDTGAGHTRYEGSFIFMVEGSGMSRMLVEVEQTSVRRKQGYTSILEMTPPGRVSVPQGYSYARYDGADLKVFSGNYAYSTTLDTNLKNNIYSGRIETVKSDGYVHFIHVVADNEAVFISRPANRMFSYFIAWLVLALVAYLLLGIPASGSMETRDMFQRNYFKTRITWILMTSLILTLVVMALVSVLFVYRRNESNLRTIMSEKINSIQSLVQTGVKGAVTTYDLDSPDMMYLLDQVSMISNGDITIYTPSGKLIMSTAQEVFSRRFMGCRMNEEAFDQIIHVNRRYFVHKERAGSHKFYCMYAPLFGDTGEIIAIICSPYAGGETYEFERDAVMHSVTILALFIILLILGRFSVYTILGRLFKPLSEMGRKMDRMDLDSLEKIDYHREDEISSLVDAYNRMVTELSESTRKLAQAERDKAWSGMARQVAHEIKNPLTPMKLQIQRIIRLKQRGDDSWQEKFDEASKVLLDHIDVLTDTANEFSTFAKLYSEEHVRLNLDTMLQEEISMFDSREDISFDYMGLRDAFAMGPKPQLTRVFVNLITNAVQALSENGGGRILVSLRNSVTDGFYDIVVEDDGPGVSPENVDKLFTPNFTTKNSGSGLGLAISRSILERCGATISYSRSFSLGGACFTIVYPK